jgi:hypothetical protein
MLAAISQQKSFQNRRAGFQRPLSSAISKTAISFGVNFGEPVNNVSALLQQRQQTEAWPSIPRGGVLALQLPETSTPWKWAIRVVE